jgi:hypothetical protein
MQVYGILWITDDKNIYSSLAVTSLDSCIDKSKFMKDINLYNLELEWTGI